MFAWLPWLEGHMVKPCLRYYASKMYVYLYLITIHFFFRNFGCRPGKWRRDSKFHTNVISPTYENFHQSQVNFIRTSPENPISGCLVRYFSIISGTSKLVETYCNFCFMLLGIHSLKLTAKAPANGPSQKERIIWTNHWFSGLLLLVSGSVPYGQITWHSPQKVG